MKKSEIRQYKERYRCGDIVTTDNPADTNRELEKVQIFRIYPMYAIVTNGRYRWCVHWTELMKTNP